MAVAECDGPDGRDRSVPGESARRVKLTRWRGRVVPFS
jgi:hypothetical protein